MWQQWTNVALGIIMAIAPFFIAASVTFTWTAIVLGLAVAIFGLWGATETNDERQHGQMAHSH